MKLPEIDSAPQKELAIERAFIKNGSSLAEFEANFGLYPVPDIIKKILHFERTVGIEHTKTFYLSAEENLYDEFFGEEAKRLIPFAHCEYSQDCYCLWNQHNAGSPEGWPVVIFGNDGGMSCVARNLEDFFVITASDRPLYGDVREWPPEHFRPSLGIISEGIEWPSPLHAQYCEYLTSIGLDLNQNQDALLEQAQNEVNPSLFAWQAPLSLAYEVEYFREHEQDHAYMLLVKDTRVAADRDLPSHLFPGAGSDTAWFEILGKSRPSSLELSVALQAADPDFHLMDYNEVDGTGYFVAIDSDGPKPGVMAAPRTAV